MLENHLQHRTYLIIQAACVDKVHLSTQSGDLDFVQLIAAKWQCLRAKIEASKEFKIVIYVRRSTLVKFVSESSLLTT